MVKKISIGLIIISFLIFLQIERKQVNSKEEIKKIINNMNIKRVDFIEIPKIKLNQIIVKGIENLSYNIVATNSSLESDSAITLYGHAIRNVFGRIKYLSKKDILYINDNKYEVINKKIITKTSDLSHLKNQVNLVTCTINPNKRLLVIAKKI